MLDLNCKKCDGRCCTSKKRELFVVLTPQEKIKFKKFSTKLQTANGILTVLKKSKFGNCIFYDKKKNICKSYQDRPFECSVYPLLIHYDSQLTFRLDSQICPKQINVSPKELKKIKQKWLQQHLPSEWIKVYSSFDIPKTIIY